MIDMLPASASAETIRAKAKALLDQTASVMDQIHVLEPVNTRWHLVAEEADQLIGIMHVAIDAALDLADQASLNLAPLLEAQCVRHGAYLLTEQRARYSVVLNAYNHLYEQSKGGGCTA